LDARARLQFKMSFEGADCSACGRRTSRMDSDGHAVAHAPHPMHRLLETTLLPFIAVIAFTRQRCSAQSRQPVQVLGSIEATKLLCAIK
jgi:hypothetical protein